METCPRDAEQGKCKKYLITHVVVSYDRDYKNQIGENEQAEREPAMEFAEFRLQPRVRLNFDDPAIIRIRTAAFDWAAITVMGLRPIPHSRRFSGSLSPEEVFAVWTCPNVKLPMIRKPSSPDPLRPLVRMTRKEFEGCCHKRQKDCIAGSQQHLDIDPMHFLASCAHQICKENIFCFFDGTLRPYVTNSQPTEIENW